MFADGVMEKSSTVGTGQYVLTGSVYNGSTFAQIFPDEAPVCYIVQTLTRTKYEIILGTYDAGPPKALRRTNVIRSSAAGALINWLPEDDYFISSFASADALAGFSWDNLNLNRPWWVQFGSWIRQNFPSTGKHTWNIWDGAQDIPVGVIDTVAHKIAWSFAIPAGIVMPFAGLTAPPNFVLCQGQNVLRSDYPLLFTAIGTLYGSVDSTHFNLPNLLGKSIVGVDITAAVNPYIDLRTMGAIGGIIESPITPITATGLTTANVSGINTQQGNISGGNGNFTTFAQSIHDHTIPALNVSVSGNVPAQSNISPSMVLNYIISLGT